jgi:hypothetical protein
MDGAGSIEENSISLGFIETRRRARSFLGPPIQACSGSELTPEPGRSRCGPPHSNGDAHPCRRRCRIHCGGGKRSGGRFHTIAARPKRERLLGGLVHPSRQRLLHPGPKPRWRGRAGTEHQTGLRGHPEPRGQSLVARRADASRGRRGPCSTSPTVGEIGAHRPPATSGRSQRPGFPLTQAPRAGFGRGKACRRY